MKESVKQGSAEYNAIFKNCKVKIPQRLYKMTYNKVIYNIFKNSFMINSAY